MNLVNLVYFYFTRGKLIPGGIYEFAACSTKVYKIYQLRKTIFSLPYNILQPNFGNLLNKGCSFKL